MSDQEPEQVEAQNDQPFQPEQQNAPSLAESLQRAAYFFPPTHPYTPQLGPSRQSTLADGIPALRKTPPQRSIWQRVALIQFVILLLLVLFFLARSSFFHGGQSSTRLATSPTQSPATVIGVNSGSGIGTSTITSPSVTIPTDQPDPSATSVAKATATNAPAATATTPPPTATAIRPTPTPTTPATSTLCKNAPSYYHCNDVDPTTGNPNCISPAFDRVDATIGSGVIRLWYNTTCLSAWTQTTGGQPMSRVKIQATEQHNAGFCNANSGTCDSEAYTLINNAGGNTNWYTNLVYAPPSVAAARSCAIKNGSSTWVCTSWYTG